MIHTMLLVSLFMLSMAILGCCYRLVKGPSMPDRIAALDSIGINLLAIIAVIGLLLQTQVFIDIILVIGILTFIGTTSFSRYIERGGVFEHGDDQQGH